MKLNKKSLIALPLAFLAVAFALPGLAQTEKAPESKSTPASTRKPGTVQALFNSADKNKDGHVTRSEAKGRLPLTYRDFAKIDKEKRGWIDFDQFMAYTNERVSKHADDLIKTGEKY